MEEVVISIEEKVENLFKIQKESFEERTKIIDELITKISEQRDEISECCSDNPDFHIEIVKLLDDFIQESNPGRRFSSQAKEYHSSLSKLKKFIEKQSTNQTSRWLFSHNITPDSLNDATESHPVDITAVGNDAKITPHSPFRKQDLDQVIASHMFRCGNISLGNAIVQDSNGGISPLQLERWTKMFSDLSEIISAIRDRRDLSLAFDWLRSHSEIFPEDSPLHFSLHSAQFILLLQSGQDSTALQYGQFHFGLFSHTYMKEIQRLMGLLIQSSAVLTLLSPTFWDDLIYQLTEAFCSLQGISSSSPLFTVLNAGSLALPQLVKCYQLAEFSRVSFQPVEIQFNSRHYRYHSVFACPVSKEPSSPDNPPVLLKCGHVIAQMSMEKLVRRSSRFKCPYCTSDQKVQEALKIHF